MTIQLEDLGGRFIGEMTIPDAPTPPAVVIRQERAFKLVEVEDRPWVYRECTVYHSPS